MSNARRPVIAGNWKMHKTVAEARAFAEGLKVRIGSLSTEVVVCPPFTALAAMKEALYGTDIKLGAQTMDWHEKGAFTGEISAAMLVEIGVTHVIIGHSERRQYFNETDESVNRKVVAALAAGLVPIVCVGESLAEREGGLTDNVVIVQVQRALQSVKPADVAGLIFAYEPVWAIGTGKTCDTPEANRVCGLVRDTIARMTDATTADAVRVQYGGSVKADTIVDQMAQSDIDGALVGGAALDVESFAQIAGFGQEVLR